MSTLITMRFTATEFDLLLSLATDQLFRKEFIDSKIPGCRSDVTELHVGKQLVQRMRLAAGRRTYPKPVCSWETPAQPPRNP